MKGAYLLLCLALPQEIFGNIIRGRKSLPKYYKGNEVFTDYVYPPLKSIITTVNPQNKQSNEEGFKKSIDDILKKSSQEFEERKNRLLPTDSNSGELMTHSSSESEEINLKNSPSRRTPKTHTNNRETGFDIMVKSGDDSPIFKKTVGWRKKSVNQWDEIEKNLESIYNEAAESIRHVDEKVKNQFSQKYQAAVQMPDEDARLNGTELLHKYNYDVQEHVVRTDDGYYLTMFRVAPRNTSPNVQKRPVVFLMHGLLGSSDDWLLMGPGKSLAYLLCDAGYDVWMGNARGSKHSRLHASKHESQPDFWQFSIDEIALNDLPAMMNYVLKTTNGQKMYYVGHSSGNTAFFALASARPEYNDKIITMYALSPMVYMNNVKSPLFRMIAPNSQYYQRIHDEIGHGKFRPSKKVTSAVGGYIVKSETGVEDLASHINFAISGVNVDNLDVNLVPTIMSHLPAGASTRQIKQYGQAVDAGELRKYDYGSNINKKIYGREQPPKYKMEKVRAPVVLLYSENDWLSDSKDVEHLRDELPNVKEAYKVPQEFFSQMDFQFSPQATEMVYKKLMKSMQQNGPQIFIV